MVDVRRYLSIFLLTVLATALLALGHAGDCGAALITYEELSGSGYVSDSDEIRLDAVYAEIVARPQLSEGPAHIEGAEYYLHEIMRDENWEAWAVFKYTPRTIIPMASAKFFIYADVAMSKLKRPGILVIMERKAPAKVVEKSIVRQGERNEYQSLDSYGIVQKGQSKKDEKGWNIGSLLGIDTEVGAATEREWDFWFIIQKFFLVASYLVGALIFVELLRIVFGAGARALASSARRGGKNRPKDKRRA